MNSSQFRIAIVRLSALGDIVNTAVVLQIIHKYYPNALIDWYVEEAFAPVLKNHPLLNEVIPVPLKKLKKTKQLSLLAEVFRGLRRHEAYDVVIDAQGLIKSGVITALLKGKKHGFDRKSAREGIASFFYDTVSSIPYEMNVIKRNVLVVTEALGIDYDENEIRGKKAVFELLERPVQLEAEINIAMVIGASWPSKCYPKESFAQLCRLLPYPCQLIWGSEAEKQDALWIAERCDNAVPAPKMGLSELVSFMGHCDLTIGNDTGPTHMAWAMNRPSITLFGPTNERMIFPTERNIGIKSPSKVDILKIDRNDFSIGEIDPHTIAAQAIALLNQAG